ncbi:MAG: hypothetical protein HPAVJP_0520 [Candidatus Hepatoplasma vulgare]|nr:MAG: hypothetical protein HPAVJP_0520 [Candidatus Hepatoplasma sp.]
MNLFLHNVSMSVTSGADSLSEGLWPSIWMSIATFLSLIVMFLIITKLLYFPIKNLLEQRQAKIKRELDEASKMNEDSYKTSEKIKEEFKQAKIEKDQIIDSSKEEADVLKKEILEKAKIDAENLLKNGRESLNREKIETWNKMKNELSSLSIELAEKILEDKINAKTEKKLIDDFLKNLNNEK